MTVLEEAQKLIGGQRQEDYGSPLENCTRIAKLWTVVLGVYIPPERVPLAMACVKIARLCANPNKRDSIVDLAGYAGLMERVFEAQGSKP